MRSSASHMAAVVITASIKYYKPCFSMPPTLCWPKRRCPPPETPATTATNRLAWSYATYYISALSCVCCLLVVGDRFVRFVSFTIHQRIIGIQTAVIRSTSWLDWLGIVPIYHVFPRRLAHHAHTYIRHHACWRRLPGGAPPRNLPTFHPL